MARKKNNRQGTQMDAFIKQVTDALKHIRDTTWLGKNSVLATPYFLGTYLEDDATVGGRGEALQAALWDAAESLWPDDAVPDTREVLWEQVEAERATEGNQGNGYLFLLLELRYLRRVFLPSMEPKFSGAIPGYVDVAPARFHVHLKDATNKLSHSFLERIRPAFRLEHPQLVTTLVGRDELRGRILADLFEMQAARSVFISGQGGLGKTSLGVAVTEAWKTPDEVSLKRVSFWYTFRPGLNDDLNSLLFALGHFLNQWGRSSLWLQLQVDGDKSLDVGQASGFLREDIKECPILPLFCFDEVDQLYTSEGVAGQEKHSQLLEFLDSLRGLVRVLYIGQQSRLDTDHHYKLEALDREQTGQLFRNLGVTLETDLLDRVCDYTEGNPRLLELYAALIDLGEDVHNLLQIPKTAAAQPLFYRLWKRLDSAERTILGNLSVFRLPAPSHIWGVENQALGSLMERGLVKSDGRSGVALLPFFSQLVYAQLPDDVLKESHQRAAVIRVELAEYTSAAYHLKQIEDYSGAVQLWYAHCGAEIQRGQANAARAIFEPVSMTLLTDKKEEKMLTFIQNHLALLAGDSDSVLDRSSARTWDPENENEIDIDIYGQDSEAASNLGRSDAAFKQSENALATLARLSRKIVDVNFARSQLFLRERNMEEVRREAAQARYQSEWLTGWIELISGSAKEAYDYFEALLELAQTLGDGHIAKTQRMLLVAASRQGKVGIAEEHARLSMEHFEKIGDLRQVEGVRLELAGIYVNARQFEKVIEPGEQALDFFEVIKFERQIASACNNLAEAYCELNQLDKAKEHAYRVLDFEIPRSIAYAQYTLGLVHKKEENLEYAEVAFQDGIKNAQSSGDEFIEAYLQRELGKLYLDQGNEEPGKDYLMNGLALFEAMGLDQEMAVTQALLDG